MVRLEKETRCLTRIDRRTRISVDLFRIVEKLKIGRRLFFLNADRPIKSASVPTAHREVVLRWTISLSNTFFYC